MPLLVMEQYQPPVQEQYQPPVQQQYQPPVQQEPMPLPVMEQYQPPVQQEPMPLPVMEQYQPPVQEQYQPPVQEQYQPPMQEQYQQPVQQQYQSPQQPYQQDTAYQQSAQTQVEKTGTRPNKFMALLCYLGGFVLIPLIAARKDPFVRLHISQGLVIAIGHTLANLLTGAGYLLESVNDIAALIVLGLATLLSIFFVVFNVIGLISALTGKTKPMPLLGGIRLLK